MQEKKNIAQQHIVEVQEIIAKSLQIFNQTFQSLSQSIKYFMRPFIFVDSLLAQCQKSYLRFTGHIKMIGEEAITRLHQVIQRSNRKIKSLLMKRLKGSINQSIQRGNKLVKSRVKANIGSKRKLQSEEVDIKIMKTMLDDLCQPKHSFHNSLKNVSCSIVRSELMNHSAFKREKSMLEQLIAEDQTQRRTVTQGRQINQLKSLDLQQINIKNQTKNDIVPRLKLRTKKNYQKPEMKTMKSEDSSQQQTLKRINIISLMVKHAFNKSVSALKINSFITCLVYKTFYFLRKQLDYKKSKEGIDQIQNTLNGLTKALPPSMKSKIDQLDSKQKLILNAVPALYKHFQQIKEKCQGREMFLYELHVLVGTILIDEEGGSEQSVFEWQFYRKSSQCQEQSEQRAIVQIYQQKLNKLIM